MKMSFKAIIALIMTLTLYIIIINMRSMAVV